MYRKYIPILIQISIEFLLKFHVASNKSYYSCFPEINIQVPFDLFPFTIPRKYFIRYAKKDTETVLQYFMNQISYKMIYLFNYDPLNR